MAKRRAKHHMSTREPKRGNMYALYKIEARSGKY
jgi:hypothetical protein